MIKSSIQNVRKVFKFLLGVSKPLLILEVIFTLLFGLTPIVSIASTRFLISSIEKYLIGEPINLMFILVLYAMICSTQIILKTLKSFCADKFKLMVLNQLSISVIDKCNDLGVVDFENSDTYDLLCKADKEGKFKVYNFYKSCCTTLSAFISLFTVIYYLSYMSSMWYLLILTAPVVNLVFKVKVGERYHRVKVTRTSIVRKTQYINYLLTNNIAVKEIKALKTGVFFSNEFKESSSQILKQDIQFYKQLHVGEGMISIIDELINVIVFGIIISKALLKKFQVSDVIMIVEGLNAIQNSITLILNGISEMYNDLLYVEHYFEFLSIRSKSEHDGGIVVQDIECIEFRNVSFKYKNMDKYVLKNLNFALRKGELVCLRGINGSGKSTLIKLICGFYDDYQGQILINNFDLRTLNKDKHLDRVGVLFQDYNRYELTIQQNVFIGNDAKKSDERLVYNALKSVGMFEKVNQMKNGIQTQLGYWFGGEDLSTGQWQKIAISRVIVRTCDLFIFDEPTASIDIKSSRTIMESIKETCKDKIGIIITHEKDDFEDFFTRVIKICNGGVEIDYKL